MVRGDQRDNKNKRTRGGFGILGRLMAVSDSIKLCIGNKWSLSQFSVDEEHEWSGEGRNRYD